MKVENSKDVVEIGYLKECQRLIEGRLKELLLPEGLRSKEFAGWPFKLAKLLVVITSPGHYATNTETPKAAEAQTKETVGSVEKRISKKKPR